MNFYITRLGLQCQTPLRSYPLTLDTWPFSLMPYPLSLIPNPCSLTPSTVLGLLLLLSLLWLLWLLSKVKVKSTLSLRPKTWSLTTGVPSSAHQSSAMHNEDSLWAHSISRSNFSVLPPPPSYRQCYSIKWVHHLTTDLK